MYSDPITDMFNRITSAQAVAKPEITLPYSEIKSNIAGILSKEGFVGAVSKASKGKLKVLKIALKYEQGLPALSGIKRVSKPGQRIYKGTADIRKVRGGFGTSIISTPKGVMTGLEAKKQNLGGEVICEVW